MRLILGAGVGLAALWAVGAAAPPRVPPVTFADDIAPLLYARCVMCHRPGTAAPFSLLTYADARARAALIAASTASRRMPPWLPAAGYVQLAGDRRLTDAEIALFQRWAQAGAPEGDPARAPAPPTFPDGWQLGTPDLVVTLPAYTVPAEGRDIYRNLVAAVPVTQTRYVRAVELRPGNAHLVHHARIMVDTTRSSRELDAQDAAPGFNGMDLMSAAHIPDGFFLGWTPGKVPSPGAPNMAWRLTPGTDLVVQFHLRPRGATEVVQGRVGFYFNPTPPTQVPAVIMLGSREIDIPPGAQHYVVEDSYELPADVDALGVYPHAHYLARAMQGFARLPNGKTRWLLKIDDWDFNWQDEYHYAEPVFLPRGAVVTMRYIYDNTAENPHNPNDPPRRVTYGPSSTDEMADLVLQVLPRHPADLARLNRDLAWKYQQDNARWYANQEYRAGEAALATSHPSQAIEHFQASLANRVDARIHAALAEAYAARGDMPEAHAHARAALSLEPQNPLALAAMARVLAVDPDPARRDPAQAVRLAERADQAMGHADAGVLDALACAYAAAGDTARAFEAAQQAVRSASAAGQSELADLLRRRLARYRSPE